MRIIKKYPNRRLYDTEKSAYITLDEVHNFIRRGEDFKVQDSNTGEDITRTILVQIILDNESGDSPIFTTEMLTKFIRFYDDAAQSLFGEFLEKNFQMFSEQQKSFQLGILDNPLPKLMQEVAENNMSFWQGMQKSFIDLATSGIQTGTTAKTDTATPDDSADKKNKA